MTGGAGRERRRKRGRQRGYTLTELAITVLMIAILSVLAIRSYSKTVRRSNRAEAIATMTTYAQQLERCYSQYFTYTLSSCATAPPATSGSNTTPGKNSYYKITVALSQTDPVTATQVDPYLITATALSTMVTTAGATTTVSNIQYKDTGCRKLYLNSLGQQMAADSSGNVSTGTCWATN